MRGKGWAVWGNWARAGGTGEKEGGEGKKDAGKVKAKTKIKKKYIFICKVLAMDLLSVLVPLDILMFQFSMKV